MHHGHARWRCASGPHARNWCLSVESPMHHNHARWRCASGPHAHECAAVRFSLRLRGRAPRAFCLTAKGELRCGFRRAVSAVHCAATFDHCNACQHVVRVPKIQKSPDLEVRAKSSRRETRKAVREPDRSALGVREDRKRSANEPGRDASSFPVLNAIF